MKGTTALLFDIDGTVLDTREFILQAAEHSLSFHGYPIPGRALIAAQVGKAFEEFYFNLCGSREVSSLMEKHREFQRANLHLSIPYPKTLSTLEKLKKNGFKLAAVTSRSKRTSVETIQRAGILDVFDAVISAEDSSGIKPDPAPLLKALEILNEPPRSAIMVGDSHLDVQAGKNAGTKTIRAAYGFHTDNLHDPKPDGIISDISELIDLLDQ